MACHAEFELDRQSISGHIASIHQLDFNKGLFYLKRIIKFKYTYNIAKYILLLFGIPNDIIRTKKLLKIVWH